MTSAQGVFGKGALDGWAVVDSCDAHVSPSLLPATVLVIIMTAARRTPHAARRTPPCSVPRSYTSPVSLATSVPYSRSARAGTAADRYRLVHADLNHLRYSSFGSLFLYLGSTRVILGHC